MKHYIFEKRFEEIFTPLRLHYLLSQIKPVPDDYEKIAREIAEGMFFNAAPKRTFFLPKDDGSYRQITLSDAKTKIIQRILSDELNAVLKFSDRSYAFRKGKSPYKAVMRVRDILRRKQYVAKADIEQFFDHIDHGLLVGMLKQLIGDKRIVHLIAYYLSQGALLKNRWMDKVEGVYQGDVLSPLLSNIYLDGFDRYLESEGVEFVRYGDDLLFLGSSQAEASQARKKASGYLAKLKLRFNPKKTYLSSLEKGFEYLGIRFEGSSLRIDPDRLRRKRETLQKETSSLSLAETVEVLNDKIRGFQNYYAKLIDDPFDLEQLQKTLEEVLVSKIVGARQKGVLRSKREIHEVLSRLKYTYVPVERKHWQASLISKAYAVLELETPLKSAKKRVANEKRDFLQKQIRSTEIVISEPGLFVGYSQGKIKVKQKGRVVLEAPINRIERILILNKRATISVYLLHECAKRKIDVDFVERSKPYAMLTYYHHVTPDLHAAQLGHHFSQKGFAIAKEIVHSKTRNQINLLKYLNRRRRNPIISTHIEQMLSLHQTIGNAKEKKKLMGIEGNIAVHYWSGFGEIVGIKGFVRTHKDSIDEINQALNYGYAILYHRVQTALIHEGFNLNYPLYHATQSNKPTLVFDMVEEFRQPVVDREILALLNRGQKLTQSNGLLSKASIKLIVQNIQDRLATPTKSRYGKTPLYNIIRSQMNHLKHTMLDGVVYKGFVNKY